MKIDSLGESQSEVKLRKFSTFKPKLSTSFLFFYCYQKSVFYFLLLLRNIPQNNYLQKQCFDFCDNNSFLTFFSANVATQHLSQTKSGRGLTMASRSAERRLSPRQIIHQVWRACSSLAVWVKRKAQRGEGRTERRTLSSQGLAEGLRGG